MHISTKYCLRLFIKKLLVKNSVCFFTFHPCNVRQRFSLINIGNYCTSASSVPFTMKLKSAEFQSIITEEVKYIQDLFHKNGHEIRIAGGAVRDLLIGKVPSDIDFATTATPTKMKEIFKENGIRILNLKGENHGTVTARINETNFEITTLRIDRVTDGRHAVVEFTEDWRQDAGRRDLTINAMFLDLDGTVYDYFNGLEDLNKRRIAFVGDPNARMREDYLRILRYFRFYGRISKDIDYHDEATISAIRDNAPGLANISGERIQMELFKIVTGNYGPELLKKMFSLDIGQYIGFPSTTNIKELDKVSEQLKKNNLNVDAMTLLSTQLETAEDVERFALRIKPSVFHRELAYFIVKHRSTAIGESLRFYQKLVTFSKKVKLTKNIVEEFLKYIGEVEILKEMVVWQLPPFPLSGAEIVQAGTLDPIKVGYIKQKLTEIWIDSGYRLTKDELKDLILEVSATYDPPAKKKKEMK
ncbi:UNVERIFIED_CONTAM: hypothetical protein PYX00_007817 [Menopon gallinae]|uniref:CCA tRNA nucleotidyltransferase 1, mitochondrial n=1 Tax=Menopon gallinae TaxID=328185 RepID=A0AAW2HKR9_9NEOP